MTIRRLLAGKVHGDDIATLAPPYCTAALIGVLLGGKHLSAWFGSILPQQVTGAYGNAGAING